LSEIIIESIRSLMSNKLRTFLSMLGIIIGVTAVITVVSIGQGTTENVTSRIASLGSNVIIVMPGISGGSGRAATQLSDILSVSDVEKIRQMCPNVSKVAPILQRSSNIGYENQNTVATIMASTPEIFDILNLEISKGRKLTYEDEENFENVVILGYDVAQEIFGDEEPLGKNIYISLNIGNSSIKKLFKVVGIMKKLGSKLMYRPDDSIIIPFSSADERIFYSQGKVNSIIASADSSENSQIAMIQIDQVLYDRFDTADKYRFISQESIMETLQETTAILSFFLGAIAAISLIVGGIGIMNIMLVSVTERTREIGVKLAIGATRKRILWEFIFESVLLTFIAGVIGILLGIGFSKLTEILASDFNLKTSVSWQSIAIAFGASTLIGLFFGIYPASKASKLDPVEALRYE
jgi:putative ABC transport system permease protein